MPTHNYLFLSDLHLSGGVDPITGKLSPNEDFFHDDPFARFLRYHVELSAREDVAEQYKRPWQLVIGGDMFDFLQVASLPFEGDELERIKGVRHYHELSENKQRYGLGTSSKEIVWKLEQVAAGHPLFFAALGWFLAHEGYELVLLKGNHDVELYWPAVQVRLRELVQAAYLTWYTDMQAGLRPHSPLPLSPELSSTLRDLESRIRFPRWYYYQPGLFYVEHGGQYDAINTFADFLEPILPLKEGREAEIELPSGSFFVRYFFNRVEQFHPFADNIKPISRYMRWAISKHPLETIKMVINNQMIFVNSAKSIVGKVFKRQMAELLPQKQETVTRYKEIDGLDHDTLTGLVAIRDAYVKRGAAQNSQISRDSAIGTGLNVGMSGLWLLALRNFINRKYGRMLTKLTLSGAFFVTHTLMAKQLDDVGIAQTLPAAAQDICRLLNWPRPGGTHHVRYLIFGHDHHPNLKEIVTAEPQPYRQWYVNTGSWLATFAEIDSLTGGDVQFTYLCVVPGLPDEDVALPGLMEWVPATNQPRPVHLFAQGS